MYLIFVGRLETDSSKGTFKVSGVGLPSTSSCKDPLNFKMRLTREGLFLGKKGGYYDSRNHYTEQVGGDYNAYVYRIFKHYYYLIPLIFLSIFQELIFFLAFFRSKILLYILYITLGRRKSQ